MEKSPAPFESTHDGIGVISLSSRTSYIRSLQQKKEELMAQIQTAPKVRDEQEALIRSKMKLEQKEARKKTRNDDIRRICQEIQAKADKDIMHISNEFRQEEKRLRSDIRNLDKAINSAPHPITVIPSEILSLVFQDFVEMNFSPWILAKVCRRWHNLAMCTPHLWSTIHISSGLPLDIIISQRDRSAGITHRSRDRFQQCINIGELDEALKRACTVPLTIKIDEKYHRKIPLTIVPDFADHLLKSGVFPRITLLILPAGCYILPYLVTHSGFPELKFTNLRQLDLFSLQLIKSQPFCEILSQQSPAIEEIRFSTFIDIPEFWISSGVLSRLRQVLLRPDTAEYDRVLPHCHSLEVFYCRWNTWPTISTPKIVFKHLKKLEVASCHDLPSFCRLEIPILAELSLGTRYCPPWLESWTPEQPLVPYSRDFAIKLPELVHLRLNVNDPICLAYFTVPKLLDLTIFNLRPLMDLKARQEMELRMFPSTIQLHSVQSFTLQMRAQDSSVIDSLRSFPNCRALQVSCSANSEGQFGTELLRRLAVTAVARGRDSEGSAGRGEGEEDILLPYLEGLELGNDEFAIKTTKDYTLPLIRILLKRRRNAGMPFKRTTVRWEKPGGGRALTEYYE